MADERTIARRYARALLEAVLASKASMDTVEAELYAVAELWRSTPLLRTVIAHPSFTRTQKRATIEKALAGKVSDLTLRFLALLVEKRRFDLVETIATTFDEVTDEAQSVAKARVRSFLPLTDAQRERLVAKLGAFTTRRTVVLDESVDPALLGGLVVHLGDTVIDGSVRGKLRRLKEKLLMREEERAQQAAANALEALST